MEYFKRENMTKEQVAIFNQNYMEKKENRNRNRNRSRIEKKRKLSVCLGNNDNVVVKKSEVEHENDDDVDLVQDAVANVAVNEKEKEVFFKVSEEDMQQILNDEKYKQFCYCSRGKNSQYYKKRLDQILNKNKNKNKRTKSMIKSELSVYEDFNCTCYSKKKFDGTYQLGLCVSVLQYLSDADVDIVLCEMSKQCDFLYFDVVTNEEYEIMKEGSTFHDKWAIISRTRNWYLKIILKYWRIIGNEILESKFFYPDKTNSFFSPNVPNTIYIRNELNEE